MDAQLSAGQAAAVYTAQRLASVGHYTNIGGGYHYSWQLNNQIVVGIGGGPGFHRNFTCNISNQFAVNLVQGGGGLPVGAGGINAAALNTSVTNALKLRFRVLILTAAFNDLGRSAQQVTFLNNTVTNRHNHRRIRIGVTTVNGLGSHAFAAGTMNGFIVFQLLPGSDTYYRNYDVRENVNATNGEGLRVTHGPVTLVGAVSQGINLHEL
jgi:hypothetical protein